MSDVTQILNQIEEGDPSAAAKLLPLVYEELRKLAAVRLANEKAGQTLQATALVHEAYIRLVKSEDAVAWDSRGHFFAAAARAMQRILVENARRKLRVKHGGEMARADIELAELPTSIGDQDLIALDEALVKLQAEAPVKAKLVVLRYFGGLTIEQAAENLGISRVTAHRYWTYARARLHREIRGEE